MSTAHHEVSAQQVAANQSNAQKSTGPRTPEGKARVALNAIKHGAYAKADHVRRQIMARRGEDPAEYEQLHQDLVDSCQPDDALQAMVVKTIGDKAWQKLQLRRAFMDRQLGSLQLTQARFERRQHAARRWPVGGYPRADQGLCGSKDSPEKFEQILEHLDRLQEWFEQETCPDEYPGVMGALYGEFPTLAGQQIRAWFIQFFEEDEAKIQEAREELPKWIAKEKRDVLQDRELYHRELALRSYDGPGMPEETVMAREAVLERQMTEHTRLLLQLKSKRSLWGSDSEAAEMVQGGTDGPPAKESLQPQAPEAEGAAGKQKLESEKGTAGKDDRPSSGETPELPRTEDSGGAIAKEEAEVALSEGVSVQKTGQGGQTNPIHDVESMT